MAENFRLPAASMDELLKVIQAYANAKEGTAMSIDEIAQATGMPRTSVSANNGFLVQVGLIGEGNKKAATETGRSLGRAYMSRITDEINRIWKEIVAEDDFLNRMISAVRIRGGMDKTSFINHIIYSSGQNDNKKTRTGAGAIIDIMKSVSLIDETDGKITVIDNAVALVGEKKEESSIEKTENDIIIEKRKIYGNNASVVININVNCGVNELDDLACKIKKILETINE